MYDSLSPVNSVLMASVHHVHLASREFKTRRAFVMQQHYTVYVCLDDIVITVTTF